LYWSVFVFALSCGGFLVFICAIGEYVFVGVVFEKVFLLTFLFVVCRMHPTVRPSDLIALQRNPQNIRNICVLAHVSFVLCFCIVEKMEKQKNLSPFACASVVSCV
jgi:hypothetical protein